MSEAGARYILDPLAPFPRRWQDASGPFRVMAGPANGYVMCRRPGAVPFVLHVSELCNAKPRPGKGPFEVVGVNLTTAVPSIGKYNADYSRLTPDEIAKPDPELVELESNSTPPAHQTPIENKGGGQS